MKTTTVERHKSPLRYPGGKAALAPYLSSLIEQNRLYNGTYAEPFAGGAGAAIELLYGEKVWRILINDADIHIYAFWKSVLDDADRFCSQIASIPITVDEWKRQHEIFRSPDANTHFDVGFATFFLNRTNRSGILDGRPIGGYDQTGNYKIDARFNRDGLVKRVSQLARYKDRIGVYNLEALEFLAQVVRPLKGSVLVYLDPPYYKMGAHLYLNFYKHEDHRKLASYITSELNHPWILSYDDVEEIRDLYTDIPSVMHTLDYHANLYKKGNEVLFFSEQLAGMADRAANGKETVLGLRK